MASRKKDVRTDKNLIKLKLWLEQKAEKTK